MNTLLGIAAWVTVILLSIAFGMWNYRLLTGPRKPFRWPWRKK